MNTWQKLETILEAILLTELLLDKEVFTPDGTKLGKAIDVELDLDQGQIWVIVHDQGEWNRILTF